MINVNILSGKTTTFEEYIKSMKSKSKLPSVFNSYLGMLSALFGGGAKRLFELDVQFTTSEGKPFKLSE